MTVPTVEPGSFLTLRYRLAGPDGADIVNTFEGKPSTLQLGSGELSPALEERLHGLREGAHETIFLAPGEAFGDRNPELVQWVARALLRELGDHHDEYAEGDVVQFPTPDGTGSYAGMVRETSATAVKFDFNHPLAGQAVTFEVELIGVL